MMVRKHILLIGSFVQKLVLVQNGKRTRPDVSTSIEHSIQISRFGFHWV